MLNLLRPKEWFLVTLQLLALLGSAYALFAGFSAEYWIIGVLGYCAMFGLGITVTFHRLLAHKTYGLWKPLEYLFALFANLGCTGSSVGWVFVHRAHHIYTDKEGDPHSPIVYGAFGAITGQYGAKFDKWMVRDIINDPVHRALHDYHNVFLISAPVILTLIFGLPGFLFGWAVPVFLNTFVSRMSNWIDHEPRFGTKTTPTEDYAHNVWWWSIVSFGEGWHNNHHAYPSNYRFGWGSQFDPGKYIINALKAVGLAWDVKQNETDWRKAT